MSVRVIRASAIRDGAGARLLLADEPTGELDTATSEDVFESLRRANAELGATVVIVTHDHAVARQVRRTVRIRNGRTAAEVLRGEPGDGGQEYAVLDGAGRIQLPEEFTRALGLGRRVRLALESDHIGVWPVATTDREKGQCS